jgi:hypothetical protein
MPGDRLTRSMPMAGTACGLGLAAATAARRGVAAIETIDGGFRDLRGLRTRVEWPLGPEAIAARRSCASRRPAANDHRRRRPRHAAAPAARVRRAELAVLLGTAETTVADEIAL